MDKPLSEYTDEELQALIDRRRARNPGATAIQPVKELVDKPVTPAKPITAGMPLDEAAASARQNLSGFIGNAAGSAARLARDITAPIHSPREVIQGLKNLTTSPEARGQVVDYYKERASDPGKTFYEDPFGAASDVALPLTVVGLASKVPGTAGRVAGTVGRIGNTIDPVGAAVNLSRNLGKGAGYGAAGLAGLTSGTGPKPIIQSARAGYSPIPEARSAWRRQYAGGDDTIKDVVDTSQRGVRGMKKQRGLQYKVNKMEMRSATGGQPIDLNPVIHAIDNSDFGKFDPGGGLPKEDLVTDKALAVRDAVRQEVVDWSKKGATTADAVRYHSAEGLDALKRKIGNIRNSQPYGSTERQIADHAYREVWKQIEKVYPDYAKMMKGYEDASNLIQEIEGSLAIKQQGGKGGVNIERATQRLLGIFRDSPSSGRRMDLVKMLQENGATHLMEMLSGRAMSPWMPQGLSRYFAGATGAGGAAGLSPWAALLPYADPTLLLALPFQSPKVVGGAAYAGGTAARHLGKLPGKGLARLSFQTRSTREEQ